MGAAETGSFSKLVAAQLEFPPIEKNRQGQVQNRFYKYADLADVLSAIRPVLNKHGLFISQPISGAKLITEIRAADGAPLLRSEIDLPPAEEPKLFGANLTYYRRYAICALLGISPDEDLDAVEQTSKTPRTPNPGARPATGQPTSGVLSGVPRPQNQSVRPNPQPRTPTPPGANQAGPRVPQKVKAPLQQSDRTDYPPPSDEHLPEWDMPPFDQQGGIQ